MNYINSTRVLMVSVLLSTGTIQGVQASEDLLNSTVVVAAAVGGTVLVSLASTTYGALDDDGRNSTRSKADFLARFRAEPSALRKDILRGRGPHYSWLVSQQLAMPIEAKASLRCLVFQRHQQLKALFDSAQSEGEAGILALRRALFDLAEQAKANSELKCDAV
jgi:hypothetical protein